MLYHLESMVRTILNLFRYGFFLVISLMCVPREKNKFVQIILKQFHIQNDSCASPSNSELLIFVFFPHNTNFCVMKSVGNARLKSVTLLFVGFSCKLLIPILQLLMLLLFDLNLFFLNWNVTAS